MLSRFSKLPGLSTFLGNNHYPQEAIDSAIHEIKLLGKKAVSNDESLQDINKILVLMKRFSESLHVQRVACHALSNLAMQVVAARWIIQKGGFQLIKKCLNKYHSDHKLAWLASSATWNLARPPANRAIIGKDGVRLMLQILNEHRNKEKVANTAVGALSNLSLEEGLKELIAEDYNLELLLSVMIQHSNTHSVPVLTSGAGLLANLAVNDDHANVLVTKDALVILMKLLTWNTAANDETLYRNTCAALNNLVTAEHFLDCFLKTQGIECVYGFLENNNNELYVNLLENCLINMDADSNVKTTSFHLCAFHGKLDVLKELYERNIYEFDLNAVDGHNMTLLDYAISQNNMEIVKFLCRCGGDKHKQKEISSEMQVAIDEGKNALTKVKTETQQAIIDGLPYFPTDLCKYMTGFQHNVDMLQGSQLF